MAEIWEIHKSARKAREAGKPVDAADWFTVGFHNFLGREPFWDHPNDVFHAAKSLSRAVICYRLGDRLSLARTRADHGGHVIEESFDRLEKYYDRPMLNLYRATLMEYLGDLRVYSGQDGDPEAYQRAIEQYWAAADAKGVEGYELIDCEEQNDYSIQVFNELVRVAEASINEVDAFDDEMTHTEWVEYKQRHLPDLVDQLLDLGIEAYAE